MTGCDGKLRRQMKAVRVGEHSMTVYGNKPVVKLGLCAKRSGFYDFDGIRSAGGGEFELSVGVRGGHSDRGRHFFSELKGVLFRDPAEIGRNVREFSEIDRRTRHLEGQTTFGNNKDFTSYLGRTARGQ